MQEAFYVNYGGQKFVLGRTASDGWYIRGKKKQFKICNVRVDVESAKQQALTWLQQNHTKVK